MGVVNVVNAKVTYEVDGYRIPSYTCYSNIIKEEDLIKRYRLFHKIITSDERLAGPVVIGAAFNDVFNNDMDKASLVSMIKHNDSLMVNQKEYCNGEYQRLIYVSPEDNDDPASGKSIDWYLEEYNKFESSRNDTKDKKELHPTWRFLDIKNIYEVYLYIMPIEEWRNNKKIDIYNHSLKDIMEDHRLNKITKDELYLISYKAIQSEKLMSDDALLGAVLNDLIHSGSDKRVFLDKIGDDNLLLYTIKHNGNDVYKDEVITKEVLEDYI